jgi:hypothetical protein
VHTAKSFKKNHILALKNAWYDVAFFYIPKNSKNIFAYIFWFNNQFIESMRI